MKAHGWQIASWNIGRCWFESVKGIFEKAGLRDVYSKAGDDDFDESRKLLCCSYAVKDSPRIYKALMYAGSNKILFEVRIPTKGDCWHQHHHDSQQQYSPSH